MNALPIAATAHAAGPRGTARSSGRPGSGDAFQGALDAQSEQLRTSARTADEARRSLQRGTVPASEDGAVDRLEGADTTAVRSVARHPDDQDRAGDVTQTPAALLGAVQVPAAPAPPLAAPAAGADPSVPAAIVTAGQTALAAGDRSTPVAAAAAPATQIPAAAGAALPTSAPAPSAPAPSAPVPSPRAPGASAAPPPAPAGPAPAVPAPLGGTAQTAPDGTASAPPAGAPAAVTAAPADLLSGLRVRSIARPSRTNADDDRGPAPRTGDPSAASPIVAAAQATPLQQTAAVAPLAAVAPPAPADPTEPTLAAQLTPPIAALVARGEGEHVVTVRVTPDNLGAVTVRAHVVAGSMKVELFATEPHARDALAAMLPDLRRDLAGTDGTGSATVGLGGDASARSDPGGSDRGPAGRPAPAVPSSAAHPPMPRSTWRAAPVAGRLDVLA